ncbi:DUF4276 family protein [Oscillospiraceae bacterium 42-9]|uniref:DUF4276 family protein n=1 Tax=Acutalibacter sp. 1XD8-36 TaxID=2320852 RepID=UPI001411BB62|nr:DUF4276 family protein [Acutalibacter sp. 1XD8-36]NBJ88496.1 DUF4276 family protein [Acutalibacter sp. 1XD8-36]
MIRVNVVAEGQTEMSFVRSSLNSYFSGHIILDSRCVLTGRDKHSGREYRGGMPNYAKAKNDIMRWLREDPSAYVTTMFDFFRLPTDFPEYDQAMRCPDHQKSVRILEGALKKAITSDPGFWGRSDRFIPYIQLHEFEALLFTDVRVLKKVHLEPDEQQSLDRLYEETKGIPPEEINHGAETAPSKRLLRAVDYQKGDPCMWIDFLTIPAIRDKCPHFSQWLGILSDLTKPK